MILTRILSVIKVMSILFSVLLTGFAFATPRRLWTPKLTEGKIAKYAMDAGFDQELLPVILCIVGKESGANPHAENVNPNGTVDYGLMQVNSVWEKPCHMTALDLKNPAKNLKCAYKVYKNQGISAWVTYQKFASECRQYKPTALLASQSPSGMLLVDNNEKI